MAQPFEALHDGCCECDKTVIIEAIKDSEMTVIKLEGLFEDLGELVCTFLHHPSCHTMSTDWGTPECVFQQ